MIVDPPYCCTYIIPKTEIVPLVHCLCIKRRSFWSVWLFSFPRFSWRRHGFLRSNGDRTTITRTVAAHSNFTLWQSMIHIWKAESLHNNAVSITPLRPCNKCSIDQLHQSYITHTKQKAKHLCFRVIKIRALETSS